MTSSFRFIDLFAGIGGLRIGFESIGGKCVFTSEWNKFSQETYRANFEDDEHEIHGDITLIDENDVPDHDLLLAGFPCQPFSLAGVSKKNSLGRAHGFADETQGTLFFDVCRIIAAKRPTAFLLENVKNLLSHDKGKTFATIRRALGELGYEIDHGVIDAQHWLPQHRERTFISGFRKELGLKFEIASVVKPQGPRPKLSDILHPEDGTERPEAPFTEGSKGVVSERYTLTDNLWKYLQAYRAKHEAAGNGFGYGLFDGNGVARTLSARYHKDGSEILIAQGPGENPRRLTPRECARLMGFDRMGSNRPWQIPVSDTQAYRQFGNAVAAPVAIALAEAMHPMLIEALSMQVENEPKVFAAA